MVWKRTTAGRATYYACATYAGRQVRHPIGSDRREAERAENELRRAIADVRRAKEGGE